MDQKATIPEKTKDLLPIKNSVETDYSKKEYINQFKGSVVKRISHLTTDQEFRVRILAEPPV